MSYQLGIDLGTTFSAAAVCRPLGDRWVAPEMVALSGSRTDVASVLFVGPDGEVLVGEAAERRAVTDPDRVVREFKRRVGDPTPIVVGGQAFAPEELCARLARWIVDRVAVQEGGPAERIAITHPASWGAHKMELLAEALDRQGITATFLAEPQAAALHYAAGERVAPGSTIAVYDLGGGTFDAAVVRKGPQGAFALQGRPEGLERLGGVDFDQVVFDHVVAGAPEAFAGLDAADPDVLAAVARLRRECTEAKEALSADTETSIPVLLPGQRASVRLHRSELEEAIRDRIEETVEALRRAVASAGLKPAALDAVLLVGGSSRVPLVAQLVSEELGRPVAVDTDPKYAIAKGAALAVSPMPSSSWPAVAVPPVPADDAPTGGIPVLVGASAGLGVPAGPGSAGFGDVAGSGGSAGPGSSEGSAGASAGSGGSAGWGDSAGLGASATAVLPSGPPPRPGAGPVSQDWEYDAEQPARRRPPVGVIVGAGGGIAALAVVLTVVFWPSAEPVVGSGLGGMNIAVPTTSAAVAPAEAPAEPPVEEAAVEPVADPEPVVSGRGTPAPAAGSGTSTTGSGRAPATARPNQPAAPAPAAPPAANPPPAAPPAAPPPAAPPANPPAQDPPPATGTPGTGTGTGTPGTGTGTGTPGTGTPGTGTGTPGTGTGGGTGTPPAAGGGSPTTGAPAAPPAV